VDSYILTLISKFTLILRPVTAEKNHSIPFHIMSLPLGFLSVFISILGIAILLLFSPQTFNEINCLNFGDCVLAEHQDTLGNAFSIDYYL